MYQVVYRENEELPFHVLPKNEDISVCQRDLKELKKGGFWREVFIVGENSIYASGRKSKIEDCCD